MDWILVGHHEASGLTLIIHNGNMGLPVQGPKTKIREIVTYFELSQKQLHQKLAKNEVFSYFLEQKP